MKIIAHGNNHTYTVSHIEFETDGTIKHILGFMEYAGKKNYPIGIHADQCNIDKEVILDILYEK